jgi:hypothetical protein
MSVNLTPQEMVEGFQTILAVAIVSDKKGLIDLLRKNGVELSYDTNDEVLIVAIYDAMAKSEYFKEDLVKFLVDIIERNKDVSTSSFAGAEDNSFFNAGGWSSVGNTVGKIDMSKVQAAAANMPVAGATKTRKSFGETTVGKFLGGFLSPDTATAIINTGSTLLINQSNRKADEAALRRQEQLNLTNTVKDLTGGGGGATTGGGLDDEKPKNRTTTFILIGVGVLILGLGAWLMLRKKGAAPAPAPIS